MNLICGVDEVGRGPAAGPVVVAAVILPTDFNHQYLTDSKLLSLARRKQMAHIVKQNALAVGIGWIGPDHIDKFGLTKSLRLAGRIALRRLNVRPERIILDGVHNYLTVDVHTEVMPKADQVIPSVAAASIVAKVARDNYMERLDLCYPEYGFSRHKGYLTAWHRAQLAQYGPSPVHRLSWVGVG